MTKILLAAYAALALSGCVTAEEMAAQDNKDCHSYGAATGTDAYFTCRMVKSQQHAIENQQRVAAIQRGIEMTSDSLRPPEGTNFFAAPMRAPTLSSN